MESFKPLDLFKEDDKKDLVNKLDLYNFSISSLDIGSDYISILLTNPHEELKFKIQNS